MTYPLYDEATLTVPYQAPFVIKNIADFVMQKINVKQQVILLCIGTDRSTGDALGPLTGTMLKKRFPKQVHIYGTLHQPVHALNLEATLHEITISFPNAYIIAIDAALGRKNTVGSFTITEGPLQPGAAFNKNLPAVGDLAITGVVNLGGMMNSSLLQSTRLSLVHDMASKLSHALKRVDMSL